MTLSGNVTVSTPPPTSIAPKVSAVEPLDAEYIEKESMKRRATRWETQNKKISECMRRRATTWETQNKKISECMDGRATRWGTQKRGARA